MGGCGSKTSHTHTSVPTASGTTTQQVMAYPAPVVPSQNGRMPKKRNGHHNSTKFNDCYSTLEEVAEALHKAGLEGSNLIFGIDFTASNQSQGRRTFGGNSLHLIGPNQNPYQQVIRLLGATLSRFDEDGLIPSFGFGDMRTKDRSVFCLENDKKPSEGFEQVLERYSEVVPGLVLSGPTSFAPLIRAAIGQIKSIGYRDYHILVIIADGQVTHPEDTKQAIVEASEWPLSIVMVGVGDGPWGEMVGFDDNIRGRRFDNFQFVDFHKVMGSAKKGMNPEAAFALAALMEVPQQYQACKDLGILGGKI